MQVIAVPVIGIGGGRSLHRSGTVHGLHPAVGSHASTGGGELIRLGHPLVDAYLDLVSARARPNTVLAAAFDLKVFFSVIVKSPAMWSRLTCWHSSRPSVNRDTMIRSSQEAGLPNDPEFRSAFSSYLEWASRSW